MSFATLLLLISLALSAWGQPTAPDIQPKLEPISWTTAVSSGPYWEEGVLKCNIIVDPARMAAYTPVEQERIITHEVGHCYGLGHFGDCNTERRAIMGCAAGTGITSYDRVMLEVVQGTAYRVFVPMVGQ